jgi:hypothetical protein
MNVEINDDSNSDDEGHNQCEENIDLAEGEDESMPIMSMMNIFNVYYNKKNKKNGNLFSGTNPFNKHSTNSRMIEFMEEIRIFKLIPNPIISEDINEFNSSKNLFQLKIPNNKSISITKCNSSNSDDNDIYSAGNSIMDSITENEEYNMENNAVYYSNNIVSLMIHLSKFNWININWEINALKDCLNK